MATAAAAATTDGWDNGDRNDVNIVLSNSDRTATQTASYTGATRSVAVHAGESSGKYYVEFLNGSVAANGVGLMPKGQSVTDGANSFFLYYSGTIYLNNSSTGTISGGFTAGDVVSLAWDSAAELGWFRVNAGNWNNSGAANPATGVGGKNLAAVFTGTNYALWCFLSSTTGSAVTVRTRVADLTQTVPSGFLPWMGETPAGVTGVQVWTGGAWVEKPAKVWSGSVWMQKPVKVWNGSAWT
jgi:hypothetical protein